MKLLLFIFTFLFCLKASFASNKLYLPFILDFNKLTAEKSPELNNGRPEIGKKIFKSRRVNCLSCHEAPIPEERFYGNFGPSLLAIGSKYSKAEIRIRIIDSKLINSDSIMPSYFKIIKYPRTPDRFLGKTILTVEEVEHLVEYLYSLK